jgi:uncharacterized membrane protein YwzB
MKQNKKIVGHIALLFVNIFFGINLSVSKELLDGTLTPLVMNVLRFLFGAVVFWTLSVMKPEKVSNKDLLMLFVGALLGSLVNLYRNPLDEKVVSYYWKMKNQNKEHNVFKIISLELEDQNISFSELINQKQELYEKV